MPCCSYVSIARHPDIVHGHKNGPKIKTETEFFDRWMIEIKIILGPIISDKNNT